MPWVDDRFKVALGGPTRRLQPNQAILLDNTGASNDIGLKSTFAVFSGDFCVFVQLFVQDLGLWRDWWGYCCWE